MKKCVLCGHNVSRGDRHSAPNCPPKPSGRREALKQAAARRVKR